MVLDAIFGEPPSWIHPVVWMGTVLKWLEARAPEREPARFMYGTAAALGMPIAWAMLGRILELALPWPVRALALKPTFAGRALLEAGQRVEGALSAGRLDEARRDLRWLVSRRTIDLDEALVAAAAIESLAENFVDSWVAPLLAYALFGLGGAYGYRAANTADAVWGYRTRRYEYLGKAAARLDDVLNWLPARAGACLLLLAGRRRRQAFAIWRNDAVRTPSPNAGQPMAVAAGDLGVRLEKRGSYVLNADAASPGAEDLAEVRRTTLRAMVLGVGMAILVCRLRDRE